MDIPTVSLAIVIACAAAMPLAKGTGSTDDLLDVVLSLKSEVAELKMNCEKQEEKYELQKKEFEKLKRAIGKCKALDSELEELKKKSGEQAGTIIKHENEVAELKMRTNEQELEIASMRTALQHHNTQEHVRDRRAPERVAFSTYLSHDQQHTGVGQKIKYDGILLNEGNGYNPHLGAFVAPARGLYLFSYSVAKWHPGEARVRLVKNGISINCAIVDVRTDGEDHQASNVAPVELDVGDVVYVEEYDAADALILGSPVHRWTTFSGVLLL